MEFEFDFGTTTTAPKAPKPSEPAGPLYASIDGMTAQVSPEECVFQIRDSEQIHVMTLDVLRAMSVMRRFDTLEAQMGRVEESNPQLKGRRDAIEPVMKFLIDRGLVVQAQSLLAAAGEVRSDLDAPIVAIRTCDRPEALARLLDSLPDADRILVVDDSRDAANIEANRGLVDAQAGQVHHLDRAWRRRLLDELATDPEADSSLAAMLLPDDETEFSGGAAFNTLLLLTAGTRPVILDDDMVWELSASPDSRAKQVSLAATADAPITLLDKTRGDWETSGGNLLPRLGGACGMPLADAAKALELELDVESLANQSFSSASRLLDQASVKTVQFGYAGDSGMDTRLWLYLMPTEQAQAWWADRSTYFSQLARPTLRHCHVRPQVSEISNFTPSAVDNSELVPPTSPCHRGEDVMFNALLRFAYPRSLNLHLPIAIAHERDGERSPENPDAYVPWSSRFFAEYALAHLDECEAQAPDARLRHLAQRFEDIALASAARRKTLLREFLGFMRSQIVLRLQGRLTASAGAPEFYQRDLTDWIEANGRALTDGRPPRLRGWSEDLDAEGCAEALARDAAALARWLRAWPVAWLACRDRMEELLRL